MSLSWKKSRPLGRSGLLRSLRTRTGPGLRPHSPSTSAAEFAHRQCQIRRRNLFKVGGELDMSFQSPQHFSETNDTVTSFAGHRAAIDSALMDETLLEQFDSHFDAIPANTIERVRAAQRIRHQVYCIEHPHEQSNDPDGLERDEFDTHAVHSLLMHRATNTALGTVRLILPVAGVLEHSFPVHHVLDADASRIFNQLPLHSTAEVSRFSISRQLRRSTDASGSHEQAGFINNSGALMRLGLI